MEEFLTTREVADLLRIKERKVYDLASSGALPCSKVIGKLLFPRAQIVQWVAGNAANTEQTRPPVFLGSHDPLLEWALRESRCAMAMLFDSSSDGLKRFAAHEGIATGLHIHQGAIDDPQWNISAVEQNCMAQPVVLIEWAVRDRGLIVSERAADTVKSIADIGQWTVVPRQPQAGAQQLFDKLVRHHLETTEPEMTEPVRSEMDMAQVISSGQADIGFGLRTVAHSHKLHFIPLIRERFDILIDRRSYFESPFQTLLDFCRSTIFEQHALVLTGYDVSGLGRVHYNSPV